MPRVITTYDELLEWSRQANHCVNAKGICQLQDEFGMSEARVIEKLWEHSVDTGDRNLIVFALHKVMGDDYLARYVQVWIRVTMDKKAMEYDNAFDLRWKKLHEKEEDLKAAKKTVAKRIQKIEKEVRRRELQISNQKRAIDALMADNRKLRNSLGGAMDQAGKFEHYAERYFDMLGMLNTLQEDMMQKKLGVLK